MNDLCQFTGGRKRQKSPNFNRRAPSPYGPGSESNVVGGQFSEEIVLTTMILSTVERKIPPERPTWIPKKKNSPNRPKRKKHENRQNDIIFTA